MANIDIDLNGWDTVFAISLEKANQAIANTSSTPSSFLVKDTLGGKWDTWKFTVNGGGQLIQFSCPVKSGTYKGPGASDPGKGIDLSGVSFTVQLQLQQVSNALAASRGIAVTSLGPSAVKASTGTQSNFVTKLTSDDPAEPAVSVLGSNLTVNAQGALVNADTQKPLAGVADGFMAKTMIEAYVKQWFSTDGLAAFKHVFAEFLIGALPQDADFAWLMPTDVSYAVAMPSNPTLANSVLGVMAMTENRSPADASNQIDGRLLSVLPNCDSVFAISGPRFVDKWLLKAAVNCHVGSQTSDFGFTDDHLTLFNRSDTTWGQFQASGSSYTTATVTKSNFRIGLSGDAFSVSFTDIQWTWDATWGQTVHANYAQRYEIELKSGTDSTGEPYKNVLGVRPYQTTDSDGTSSDEAPTLTFTVTESSAAQWEKLAIDIGTSVIGSIVGGALAGKLAGAAAKTAAEGGTQALEQTAVNLGKELATAGAEGSLKATSEAGANLASEGLTEASTGGLAKAGAWLANKATTFGKFIYRVRWTLAGSVIGGAAGAAVGDIPRIIEALGYDELSDIPSFDDFAGQAVASVHWPSNGAFQLTGAKLAGALVLGGTLTNPQA